MVPLGSSVAVVKPNVRVPVVAVKPGTWSVGLLKTAAVTALTAPCALAETRVPPPDIRSTAFAGEALLKVETV